MSLLQPEDYADYTASTPIADAFIKEIKQTIKDVSKEDVTTAIPVGWRNKGNTTALLGFFDVTSGGQTIHRSLEIPPGALDYTFIFFSIEGMESCLRANEETLRRKKVEPRYCWHMALPRWRKSTASKKESK